MTSIGRMALYATLALAAVWPSGALAQTTLTRTSSFAYDAGTGLLTQEVIEPGTPSLRLQTDYTYDAFGNKTQVTVSGVGITTRSSSTSYAPSSGSINGEFVTSRTNALSQTEAWQYHLSFGKPTSHTGPNGLTTTWSYDSFGRKTLEVRADHTQTKWAYQFCSGVNGGTAACVTGASYVVQTTPLAADGQTQNGPLAIAYFDSLDRQIAGDTQGFDGSTIRVSTQYDALGRVRTKSRRYFVSGGTQQLTTYTYDGLSRVVTESLADGHTIQHAFHGLVTTDTNQNNQTRTLTKNSQGQVVSVADAVGNVTTYYYDPFGNLLQTVDPTGKNVVVNTYDLRGRKTQSNDPDLGIWNYLYDPLNQLVQQTDAKSQTSQLTYDVLGRLTQRVEADMTATWTYDGISGPTPPSIGKLVAATATGAAAGSNGFQRTLTYDSLGRPSTVTTTIDGNPAYTARGTYDANGRLSQVTYPSGFAVNYGYTSLGYVQQITDAGSGQVYWTANARDAELHLTQDTAGNGVTTARGFDAPTGRLLSIVAGSGNGVANFSYAYDGIGNVLSRADGYENVSETFTYDALNRLTSSTVNLSPTPLVKTFSYDPLGNLLSKSDVGNYAYPEAGLLRPHGVTSIDGGIVQSTFTYDPNGNQTSGLGRTVIYNSYNKPSSIQQGSLTLGFSDDVDHQRYKQTMMQGPTVTTTRYFDAFGIHAELVTSATTQWNDYLMVGGSMVGVRFLQASTVTLRYFHQDHLGSIAVLTDQNGAVVERDAYDAWGKRRFPNGTDDPTGSIVSQTIQGFTGQEMLGSVGLVHLNGRVYDPYVGRMTSADPMVPDPLNGQTWNRYSYVINNPLAFTDPTGYCFLGLCGIIGDIGRFFTSIGNFLSQNAGSLIQIAVTSICAASVVCAPLVPLVAAGTAFAIAGITTGNLDYALRAGLIAGVSALAFEAVGQITSQMPGAIPLDGTHGTFDPFSAGHIANILGHAAIGCGMAVASGSSCGSGALAGGITSAAGPFLQGLSFQARVITASVLGGLASVAGGGKFMNGAVTGAFGYLMNELGRSTAADQPSREDLFLLEQIVNDPIIGSQIDAAWTASSPGAEMAQENGFWISRNPDTGELFTRPFANPGIANTIMPGPSPDDAVAFFHTHPFLQEDGYLQQPSPSDLNFAAARGLPGIVQSHNGMYYFGPVFIPWTPPQR
jgi:RHS repeat-associated protein